MPKRSAGLLLYRLVPDSPGPRVEVLLAHPGGPLHARKDVWSVPKGEYGDDEQPLAAAYREWAEEIGHPPPAGEPIELGEIVQKGGKRVVAWALAGDLDPATVVSNTFTMTWQGRRQEFPEIDRADWFDLAAARAKILPAQESFLDRLATELGAVTPDR